jgi:hypothetical protein
MDMCKPFRTATARGASNAAILFDKSHIMRHLGVALDQVRKSESEYALLTSSKRRLIRGQKYTLLSNRESLDLEGRRAADDPVATGLRVALNGLPASALDSKFLSGPLQNLDGIVPCPAIPEFHVGHTQAEQVIDVSYRAIQKFAISRLLSKRVNIADSTPAATSGPLINFVMRLMIPNACDKLLGPLAAR